MPEQCTAGTAVGTLDDCLAVAAEVIQSNLTPAFVTATPKNHTEMLPNQIEWEIAVGFEGFKATLAYQLEKCGGLLKQGNLKNIDRINYSQHDGLLAETYAHIAESAYILRTGLPLTQISDFLSAINADARGANIMLDLGCGRIFAGLENLSDDPWQRYCHRAQSIGGHVILEKAPHAFKQRHDVFGLPRPEWKMMHKVKAALDPENIFSPGRLPGKR
jgi:FAD/FMN-containing dehydrogenase